MNMNRKRSSLKIDVEYLRSELDYDASTGVFRWKNPSARNIKPGDVAGCVNADGYIVIKLKDIQYKAHRLAYAHVYGDVDTDVDHYDGDRTNNRLVNLRPATNKINSQNRRRAKRTAKSKLIGAFYRKRDGKWTSSIKTDDGRRIFLGVFENDLQASAAYVRAKREHQSGGTI